VIPYFSLASGFLAGKYRSEADLANSARGNFVKKYLNERGYKILSALDQVAKTHSATQSQVAHRLAPGPARRLPPQSPVPQISISSKRCSAPPI